MDPKEKAKELANKFVFKSILDMDDKELKLARIKAKQCGIICVDEIIDSYQNIYDDFVRDTESTGGMTHMKDYWKQVKQEIEKL